MRARPGPGIIQSAIRRRIFRIVFAPVALYIRGRDALDGPTPGARFGIVGLTRGGNNIWIDGCWCSGWDMI
jgi:hypothetical protein